MHDRVEPVVAVVDTRERASGLAEVGEVDAGEGRARVRRGHTIQVRDQVVVCEQLVDYRAAELAAPTCHRDTHRAKRNARRTSHVVGQDAGWSLAG
jgi:hypothetical protein